MRSRASALALAVALLASGRADAYVRSKTEKDMKVKFWAESCIPVTIYLNKFKLAQYPDARMSLDAAVKSLTAAAHAWSPDAVASSMSGVSCDTYLEIVPTFASIDAKPPAVASDHRNSVIFRTDNWTQSGLPTTTPKVKQYSQEAVAVTTVFALPDGRIQDADIEINAMPETWHWANLDEGVVPPPSQIAGVETYDLQTALTHEFGHLLGLEHTCFNAANKGDPVDVDGHVRPTDDMGKPVPDCANAPSSVELTVMYYQTADKDTSKRVLSSDEVRFLCEVYPASKDPQTCRADQPNTGCAMAPTAARRGAERAEAFGLLGLGGVLLAAATHRARARRLAARGLGRMP